MSGEIIGAWALNEFGKEFLSSAKELIKRKTKDEKEQSDKLQALERCWQNFNWGKSAERYKKHMQEIYGHIRVIGTTEPIPIGDIFTDVYILDKPKAYRRFDMMKLQEIQKEPEKLDKGVKRDRGLKIVVQERGHRLYILGKPGAGKTTFMKYLVHQTIVAKELNKLPIFVTLRDWDARDTDLLDFIVNEFAICDFPDAKPFVKYLLETGRAIVLFDGLDEIPQEKQQRDKTIQALHNFSKKYLQTQIIITCRVAASDYSFTEFTYIEMADFSTAQVNAYVRNWFRKDPDTAEEFLEELALDENKGVRDLGRSPLLLSMICLAYAETLSIPKRRVELYEDALDALLKKWDSSRKIKRDKNYKNLSLGRKKQLFARLAAEYFEKGEIFFRKRDIAKKIETFLSKLPPDSRSDAPDGEAILDTISAQHGIVVERVKGIYSFSHLTFQEYYTAKYIAENAVSGTLNQLVTHVTDRRWREIFLLTAGVLPDATELLQTLQITAQSIIINNPKILGLQKWAKKQATDTPHYKNNAKRALYWYVYLSFGVELVLCCANEPQFPSCSRFVSEFGNTLFIILGKLYNLSLELDSNIIDIDQNSSFGITLASETLEDFRFSDLQEPPSMKHVSFFLGLAEFNVSEMGFPDIAFVSVQKRQSCQNITFDILTSQLILITSLWNNLKYPDVKNWLSIFYTVWKKSLPSTFSKKTDIPTLHKNMDIQEFRESIYEFAEKFSGISLEEITNWESNKPWDTDDLDVVLNYLEANFLIRDCLQIADFENYEAMEDVILNMPDTTTEIRSYLPHKKKPMVIPF